MIKNTYYANTNKLITNTNESFINQVLMNTTIK